MESFSFCSMGRRKNRITHFIRTDYGAHSGGHCAGDTQTAPPSRDYQPNEVPELWRKHANEPWRVIFPDLEWSPEKPKDGP